MKGWVCRSLIEVSRHLSSSADEELLSDLAKIIEIAETHLGFVFWHPQTEGILTRIELTESMRDLALPLRQVRRCFGLQHVSLSVTREDTGRIFRHRVLTTMPRDWVAEYVEERYQMWDPQYAEPTPEAPALLEDLARTSPMAEEYLSRATLAGIGPSGLISWTEVLPGTVIAVAMISSRAPAAFRRCLDRVEHDLLSIGRALAAAFARANGATTFDPGSLSDEELALLRDLASGGSRFEASPEFEAPRSGLFSRAGTRTLTQAAVAAAATGILSSAPLRTEDFSFA